MLLFFWNAAADVIQNEVKILFFRVDLVVVEQPVYLDQISASTGFNASHFAKFRVHFCSRAVHTHSHNGKIACRKARENPEVCESLSLLDLLRVLNVPHTLIVHLEQNAVFSAHDRGVNQYADGDDHGHSNHKYAEEFQITEQTVGKEVV